MGGDIWDTLASVGGATLGTMIAPGIGTAIGAGVGSGLSTGVKTGDPLAGLASAGLSGVGTYAGNVIGSELGDITGGIINQTPTEYLGLNPTNAVSDLLNQSTIGSLAGGALGGSAANAAGLEAMGVGKTEPQVWQPTRTSGYSMPSSLGGLGSLSPTQQSSAIATQGMYGGGQGAGENKYFLNLVNNRLMDTGGGSEELSPIEQSYLYKLGLGGSDRNELLRGIETYNA